MMPISPRPMSSRGLAALLRVLACVVGVGAMAAPPPAETTAASAVQDLPPLPSMLQAGGTTGPVLGDLRRPLTLDAQLQTQLTEFIAARGSPIAGVVIVEVKSGRILALAEGQTPGSWGGASHSVLHTGFPAASLFKTVVSSAVMDVLEGMPDDATGLLGGCSHVSPTGIWLTEPSPTRRNQMSHERAFGSSCNGFFAKLGVSQVGLSALTEYAHRFAWGTRIPADFAAPASPIQIPNAAGSSAHTVGQFAAGFGYVGMSPLHAAWMMTVIGADGQGRGLRIFDDGASAKLVAGEAREVMRPQSAVRMRQMMARTILGGTATYAFRPHRYRILRDQVGGKTGTLTGHSPAGLTTWFAGLMPLDRPEIAVAAVVVLPKDRVWHIKGPSLAAEAFRLYYDSRLRGPQISQKSDNNGINGSSGSATLPASTLQ